MRAICFVFVMILASCSDEPAKSSLEEYDGGPLDKDSEIQSTDTEPTNDSEEDSEEGSDTDPKDSETQGGDTSETDPVDSDPQDTDTLDTEEPEEPEPCIFAEKTSQKCEGNSFYECKEDPNSSVVELIWIYQGDCPSGTECTVQHHPTKPIGYASCYLIGECYVGQVKCDDDQDQLLECVLDEESGGGGYWEVKQDCAGEGLQCWISRAELKCAPQDWVHCGEDEFRRPFKPGDIHCTDDRIVECSEDYHWVDIKDCSEDGLTCGEDDEDGWVCYDQCEHTCTNPEGSMVCEDWGGTVVYNAGKCLNGWECCKA